MQATNNNQQQTGATNLRRLNTRKALHGMVAVSIATASLPYTASLGQDSLSTPGQRASTVPKPIASAKQNFAYAIRDIKAGTIITPEDVADAAAEGRYLESFISSGAIVVGHVAKYDVPTGSVICPFHISVSFLTQEQLQDYRRRFQEVAKTRNPNSIPQPRLPAQGRSGRTKIVYTILDLPAGKPIPARALREKEVDARNVRSELESVAAATGRIPIHGFAHWEIITEPALVPKTHSQLLADMQLITSQNTQNTKEAHDQSELLAKVKQTTEQLKKNPDSYRDLIDRASAYQVLKQFTNALADYSAVIAVETNKPHTVPPGVVETAFYSRAQLNYRVGRYREAADEFGQIIARDTDSEDAFRQRGDCYLKLGEYQNAIDDYTQSITLSNDANGSTYFVRAQAYAALGDKTKSEADLDAARKQGFKDH